MYLYICIYKGRGRSSQFGSMTSLARSGFASEHIYVYTYGFNYFVIIIIIFMFILI